MEVLNGDIALLRRVVASVKSDAIKKYIHSQDLSKLDILKDKSSFLKDSMILYTINACDIFTDTPCVIFTPKKKTEKEIIIKLTEENMVEYSKFLYQLFTLLGTDVIVLLDSSVLLLKDFKKIYNIK